MNIEIAANFYNNSGITEDNLPFSMRSKMLFDRVRKHCETLIFPGSTSLEIGCGNGRHCFELEKMGSICTGVDCADEIVKFANDYAQKNGSKSNFVVQDAVSLSFEKSAFDFAFLLGNNIVEFSYSDIDKLCDRLVRILKPTGIFCVSMNDIPQNLDCLIRDSIEYDYENAKITSNYTIPDRGVYSYEGHIWTVGMAKHIFSTHFCEVDVKKIGDTYFWLECRNSG